MLFESIYRLLDKRVGVEMPHLPGFSLRISKHGMRSATGEKRNLRRSRSTPQTWLHEHPMPGVVSARITLLTRRNALQLISGRGVAF
ncbi:hypothetical protein [Burkholderia cenocepacia]|uniref:hypothetical protein n=1 Tax=Burkholderia cenocepacia TaxID=95486 RepID=UPI0012B5F6F1|nr:hypothetical protein [Burkholderia cenocepacia]